MRGWRTECAWLGETLARFAHKGDRFGKDDPNRVADLHGLLVARPLEVEPGDRSDGHLDREANRVVREGDLLRALHLLRELAEAPLELLGIAERIEGIGHRIDDRAGRASDSLPRPVALPEPSATSTALVTGASSGIGEEIARQLAARGHGVTLVARREDRLKALADEIYETHGVRAEHIAADLGSQSGRDEMLGTLDGLGLEVEILVNNAGFGGSGAVHRTDAARLASMVALNCEALVYLQARFSPGMSERGRGAIINIASTAAFQPIPGTATYAATKAFVLSLSEGTHSELGRKGVTVTAVCPGPVKTEFAEQAGIGEANDKLPGFIWTDVEQVAREAVEGAEKGSRVVVPGLMNRAGTILGQHTPRAVVLPLAKRAWRSAE